MAPSSLFTAKTLLLLLSALLFFNVAEAFTMVPIGPGCNVQFRVPDPTKKFSSAIVSGFVMPSGEKCCVPTSPPMQYVLAEKAWVYTVRMPQGYEFFYIFGADLPTYPFKVRGEGVTTKVPSICPTTVVFEDRLI